MRVLMWHVHGSWATSFVHGPQTTLVPVTPDRGPDGRGRPDTFTWPDRAVEVAPERLRDEHVDVVVLQRPHELELAESWLGRRPGRDVPAVYVEHDTPGGRPPTSARPRRSSPTAGTSCTTAPTSPSCTSRTSTTCSGTADEPPPSWSSTGSSTPATATRATCRARAS
ncbi:hypothetical protein ACFQHO_45170 [Actinomadura yumaensis]|uniref:hypothetical protein n=1 Tax=Actinomadura yumaensis TaxID=111807 RepID=UPI0036119804